MPFSLQFRYCEVFKDYLRSLALIMAHILPPPPNVGYVPNPNLVLPLYLLTEVHPVRLEDGQVVMVRRPRPLSVIAGARVVLQCDPDRLRR
jgi:hypothetical protein